MNASHFLFDYFIDRKRCSVVMPLKLCVCSWAQAEWKMALQLSRQYITWKIHDWHRLSKNTNPIKIDLCVSFIFSSVERKIRPLSTAYTCMFGIQKTYTFLIFNKHNRSHFIVNSILSFNIFCRYPNHYSVLISLCFGEGPKKKREKTKKYVKLETDVR